MLNNLVGSVARGLERWSCIMLSCSRSPSSRATELRFHDQLSNVKSGPLAMLLGLPQIIQPYSSRLKTKESLNLKNKQKPYF